MSAPVPTRAAIDAAGELTFPDRKPPAVTITIHAVLNGFTFDATFTGSLSQLGAAVERLKAIGAEPVQPAAPVQAGSNTARKPGQAPAYNDAGEECCPIHTRTLRGPNKWGKLYCTAKDGEDYCKYTWKVD